MAEILRVIDGPLAAVRDLPPEQLVYEGAARNLPAVWCRLHACLRDLLEGITIGDLTGCHWRRCRSRALVRRGVYADVIADAAECRARAPIRTRTRL